MRNATMASEFCGGARSDKAEAAVPETVPDRFGGSGCAGF
jgi:hypothetical protein